MTSIESFEYTSEGGYNGPIFVGDKVVIKCLLAHMPLGFNEGDEFLAEVIFIDFNDKIAPIAITWHNSDDPRYEDNCSITNYSIGKYGMDPAVFWINIVPGSSFILRKESKKYESNKEIDNGLLHHRDIIK